jgi:hypothetical protein
VISRLITHQSPCQFDQSGALPVADLAADDYSAHGAHALGQRGRSRLLERNSEGTDLLIEGEQRWPVEFKVGRYPGWQQLGRAVPVLRLIFLRKRGLGFMGFN